MLIAKQKRKENIAEYVLYMWQIEDLIRANDLNIDKIDRTIISKFEVSSTEKEEIKKWYGNLIDMIRAEHIIEKGHLQIVNNVLIKLTDLHNELLKSTRFPEYGAEFFKTLPFIVELRAKAGENKSAEIETCFNALYGYLLLRLQNKEITPETVIAIKQISKFLATLSALFKKNEEKPIFDDEEDLKP